MPAIPVYMNEYVRVRACMHVRKGGGKRSTLLCLQSCELFCERGTYAHEGETKLVYICAFIVFSPNALKDKVTHGRANHAS